MKWLPSPNNQQLLLKEKKLMKENRKKKVHNLYTITYQLPPWTQASRKGTISSEMNIAPDTVTIKTRSSEMTTAHQTISLGL